MRVTRKARQEREANQKEWASCLVDGKTAMCLFAPLLADENEARGQGSTHPGESSHH